MRRQPSVKRQALSSCIPPTEGAQANLPNAGLASAPASDQSQQAGLAGGSQQKRPHDPVNSVSAGAGLAAAQADAALLHAAGQMANAQQQGSSLVEGPTDEAAGLPGGGRNASTGLHKGPQANPGRVQANAAAFLATSKPAFLPEEDDYDADD